MNFRALERSVWVLEKSWNSPGNLFLKKGTNPDISIGDLAIVLGGAYGKERNLDPESGIRNRNRKNK